MTAQGHEPRASQARTDAYPLQILELGRISYANAWQFQKLRHDSVLEGIVPDTLLLLEHDPVITMGRGGLPEHIYVTEEILAKKGIELFWVERGGMATYHGPGQLVAYPILHLRDRDLHAYMERLLDVLEATVEHFGVKAERSVHGPGLWVNGAKVASIGMAVRKWVSYHGIALNVSLDLSPFSLISPCGNPTERMTSLERECGKKIDFSDVQKVFVDNFLRVFGYYQSVFSLQRISVTPYFYAVKLVFFACITRRRAHGEVAHVFRGKFEHGAFTAYGSGYAAASRRFPAGRQHKLYVVIRRLGIKRIAVRIVRVAPERAVFVYRRYRIPVAEIKHAVGVPQTVANFGTERLVWTVPLVFLGLCRYLRLTYAERRAAQPERALLRDPWLPLLLMVVLPDSMLIVTSG